MFKSCLHKIQLDMAVAWLRRFVAGLEATLGHVGFAVDKVTLGQVFIQCFGFHLLV